MGRNYREHAKEMGSEVPKEPLLFLKPPSSVIHAGAAIELPPDAGLVSYEGEIGIVIGTVLRKATADECVAGIHGIVAANDVSSRDWQKNDGQWARAKGSDTFLPLGDESLEPFDLANLTVVTRVNGEERQRGSSAEMVFSIPTLLAYISTYMTLEPGDVVLTGTPSGVGPLKHGDIVEVEVVGHSIVRNPVTAL